ncbi:metallophosphoesterase, partial [Patescibacteria group bacterium]|nr:metallophosphoesterase [Patescibacteria group bacterium]MBU1449245.1 metallophosphoesterase [Patescibacteria group bacterium]
AGAATALPPLLSRTARAWHPGLGQALLVSDIHFNPYADVSLVPSLISSPASQWDAILASSQDKRLNCYGQETNYNLLNYGFKAMRAACPQPDCVIFTGDLPCHGVWDSFASFSSSLKERDQFITKLVEFMGLRFKAAFPGAPVYFALGNNDSFCADYKITPRGNYLHATAPVFSRNYLKESQPSTPFLRDYQNLGCYNLPGPLPGLRVVAINSNYLSRHWTCQCCPGAPGDPAREQLDWLEAQLGAAAASGQAVWLLMHIPPGVNAYNTVKLVGPDGKLHTAALDLQEAHNARLQAIMRKNADVLRAGFCGHTHMDHFRVHTQGQSALAMQRVTPALNTLFGGNPAFQVLSYSQSSFAPLDLVTYYLDLESALDLPGPGEGDDGNTPTYPYWRWEYAFNAAYGTESLSPGALWSLSQAMRADEGLREKFRLFYDASRAEAPGFSQAQAKAYWCALAHLEPQDYVEAYNSTVLSGLTHRTKARAA